MNNGWQNQRIDELATFINGLWKGEKPPFVNVGVIRNTNFTMDGGLDHSDIAYLDVEAKKFKSRRLQAGDIILEKSGGGPKQAVGRVALFERGEGEFSFSNFTSVIRVNDSDQIESRYLHKYLFWMYVSGVTEAMQNHSTGIRNLDGNAYKGIKVKFPHLREQKRIIGVLDEAFEAISVAKANAEKNLQNARSLFEAHLRQVFLRPNADWSDRERSLLEMCDLVVDCEHKTAPTQERGIPSIRTPNIGKGNLILDDVNRVSDETYREWTRRAVPLPGDLILAREAPAGNVAVIPEGSKVCLGQRTVLIRPNRDAFVPEFLAYLLLSPNMQDRLLAHSRGATVEHVNMKDIRALRVGPIPPLDKQREIAGQIAAVSSASSRLVQTITRKITALDELKKSLLHQAFTGKL